MNSYVSVKRVLALLVSLCARRESVIEAKVPGKVADLVREELTRRFSSELVFDPIKVVPMIDHDGDEYLRIYIVFDGDLSLLPPVWRLELLRSIQPQLTELGVLNIPNSTLVEKSEWEKAYKDKYSELS